MKYAELYMAQLASLFGAILLLPSSTFKISASYKIMASIASEHVWGSSFVILAILQFYARLYGNYTHRIIVAKTSVILWTIVTTSFVFSSQATTAIAPYFVATVVTVGIVRHLIEERSNPYARSTGSPPSHHGGENLPVRTDTKRH